MADLIFGWLFFLIPLFIIGSGTETFSIIWFTLLYFMMGFGTFAALIFFNKVFNWRFRSELKEIPEQVAKGLVSGWFALIICAYIYSTLFKRLAIWGIPQMAIGAPISTAPTPVYEFTKSFIGTTYMIGLNPSAVGNAMLQEVVGSAEEGPFRIIMYEFLKTKIGTGGALAIQAVTFGLYHFVTYPNLPTVIGTMFLGLILGVVYHYTNSYLAVSTAHKLYNVYVLFMQ